MQWKKYKITLSDGIETEAQAPVIISASRATDIPTFYSDWFINRWEAEYLKRINPFERNSDNINSVAITPNGKYIVSGGGNSFIEQPVIDIDEDKIPF